MDPAQRGLYAISIAHIAQTIGLPAWFVEIRHAATHENLPELELLREGAKSALRWLKEQYWDCALAKMTLSSSTLDRQEGEGASNWTRPHLNLEDVLAKYKRTMKGVRNRDKGEVITDATVRSAIGDVVAFVNSEMMSGDDQDIGKENTLEEPLVDLVEVLVQPGYLVPLGKK